MFTQACVLTLKDGITIQAKVIAASPHDEQRVAYSGAADRLPRRFEKCSPPLLVALFKNIAAEIGARLTVRSSGVYDCWAE